MSLVAWLVVALGGLAFAGLCVIFLMIRVMRSSQARQAEEALQPLVKRVSKLLERAEQLKVLYDQASGEQNPDLPPLRGATRKRTVAAKEKLDAVWARFADLQRLLEKARKHSASGSNIAGAHFRETIEMVQAADFEQIAGDALASADQLETELTDLKNQPIQAVQAFDDARALTEAAQVKGATGSFVQELLAGIAERDTAPWPDAVAVADRARALRNRALDLARQHGVEVDDDHESILARIQQAQAGSDETRSARGAESTSA
ncbi:MAG: hypothetical protein ACYS22_06460 [Planctomycetota bacterium]